MELGLLTVPFGQRSLAEVAAFACDAGFDALEIAAGPGSAQVDPSCFSGQAAEAVGQCLECVGLGISSLAYYANPLDPVPEQRRAVLEHLIRTIDAAAALEVPVVCTLAGNPLPGQDRMRTIEEEFPLALRPAVDHAGEKGIRIAFENYHATILQNLEHWRRAFEVLPDAHVGLNFDPSHLVWQGIDHLAAIEEFRDRIFHTHAKDVAINERRLRRIGCLGSGWWRYVIPGHGRIHWGETIGALRAAGYRGVLSIEHEDSALGCEEGFVVGARFLSQFL
ncbi:MAG: sugar phosphate isomerase/epimerase [Armatimonadetes bacterium]|nr:sugar phosphate isomerase/epimerase [Armatimonadota bacterium]